MKRTCNRSLIAMSIDSSVTETARPVPPRRAPRPRARRHVVFLVMCSAAILGAFVLGVNKSDHIATPWLGVQLPSVCQFRNVTGLDCPGCGLTRAFVSIAHGRIAEAFSYNGASLLVFGFVSLQIPYRMVQIWRIRNARAELYWPRTTNVILIVVAGALFVQWGLKLVRYFWE